MDKKKGISVLCLLTGVLLVGIAGNLESEKTMEPMEENITQPEIEVEEEKPILPIVVEDAITVTCTPSEGENGENIAGHLQICEAEVDFYLPKRFWQQEEYTQQNAHIAEYQTPDGTLMARERVSFRNDDCHFNLYVVCHVSDENMELLKKQTKADLEEELLAQSGLQVKSDELQLWEQSEETYVYGVAYQDELVDYTKYYFRYLDLQNHQVAYVSVGLADATDEETTYMKDITDNMMITAKTFSQMEEMANAGEISALYYCGRCYVYGYGVEQSYETGFDLLMQAAEAGNASSQNYVGYAYLNGNGVEADSELAVEWFIKAAEAGNGEAMNNLGNRYYDGNGIEQDYEKAVEWYEAAIEAGNTTAYYNLANRYRYGDGVKQDKEKAIALYEQAAEAGIMQAYTRLGNMYYDGEGVTQDIERAKEYFQLAADAGDQVAIDKLNEID